METRNCIEPSSHCLPHPGHLISLNLPPKTLTSTSATCACGSSLGLSSSTAAHFKYYIYSNSLTIAPCTCLTQGPPTTWPPVFISTPAASLLLCSAGLPLTGPGRIPYLNSHTHLEAPGPPLKHSDLGTVISARALLSPAVIFPVSQGTLSVLCSLVFPILL